jgi:hypothetical protein
VGKSIVIPILGFWRWRWELTIGLSLTAAEALSFAIAQPVAPFVIPSMVVVLLLDRPSRSNIRRRVQAVLVEHRIRRAMRLLGAGALSGRSPRVLWATLTDHGERVWLWCPLGTDVRALAAHAAVFTTAGWADEVWVDQYRRHPQIAALDLVRRGRPYRIRSSRFRGRSPAVGDAAGRHRR